MTRDSHLGLDLQVCFLKIGLLRMMFQYGAVPRFMGQSRGSTGLPVVPMLMFAAVKKWNAVLGAERSVIIVIGLWSNPRIVCCSWKVVGTWSALSNA